MYRLLCCLLATPTTSIVQGATFFKVCNAYVIQGARGSSAKQSKARQLYKRQGGRASFSCLGGLPSPLSLCLAAAAQTCFANPVCQDSRDPLQEHSMSCICKQILLPFSHSRCPSSCLPLFRTAVVHPQTCFTNGGRITRPL